MGYFTKEIFVPRDKKILVMNSAFLLHEIQISSTHEKKKPKNARLLSKTSLVVFSYLRNLAVMYFTISFINWWDNY